MFPFSQRSLSCAASFPVSGNHCFLYICLGFFCFSFFLCLSQEGKSSASTPLWLETKVRPSSKGMLNKDLASFPAGCPLPPPSP